MCHLLQKSVFNLNTLLNPVLFPFPQNNSISRRGEQRFLILDEPSPGRGRFYSEETGPLASSGERVSVLVITSVHEMDSGQYSCVAENRAGKAEANFTLQVG